MFGFRSARMRHVGVGVLIVLALPTLWFGMRTYRSYLLLRSAYEVGAPQVSAIRGWMTLRYVASRYRLPESRLISELGLLSQTDPDIALKSLAEREHLSAFAYVQRVQRAVAAAATATDRSQEKSGWLDRIGEEVLSALLVYGYPVLAATLFLGALGLPVPTGLSVTVVGSLSAVGHLHWLSAWAVAVVASLLGDGAAYAIGRVVGKGFLERRGRWIGYTARRQARVQVMFERWGAWTVLITRTLASHLSSVVSLLAGLSRYRLTPFLLYGLAGRVIWTLAYLGLGYGIGGSFEAATEFLTNLSALLVLATALLGAGLVAFSRPLSVQ